MIIVRVLAGLGNQLFQYALAKSMEMHGQQVYLDIKKPYRDYENQLPYQDRSCELRYFRITLKQVNLSKMWQWRFLRRKTSLDKLIFHLSSQGKWPYLHINEKESFGRYNKQILSLKGNYYVAGTFQNENYFKDIRPILLHDLTLKENLRLPVLLDKLLQHRNVVSVHVRRGDYVAHKRIYGLCHVQYYQKAMQYMKERVDAPVFLFFSDEIENIKEEFSSEENEIYYVDSQYQLKDYEELMLMSRCTHNIIANSSFSWWGAWLNQHEDKIIIAPKVWRRDFPSYDIVPPEWIKI